MTGKRGANGAGDRSTWFKYKEPVFNIVLPHKWQKFILCLHQEQFVIVSGGHCMNTLHKRRAGGKFPKKTARRTRGHRRRDVIRFRLRNRRRPLLMRWKHYSAILHSKRHRPRLPPSFYPRPKRKGKRREIKTRICAWIAGTRSRSTQAVSD